MLDPEQPLACEQGDDPDFANIIDRLRAAYDAGATLHDITAHLEPLWGASEERSGMASEDDVHVAQVGGETGRPSPRGASNLPNIAGNPTIPSGSSCVCGTTVSHTMSAQGAQIPGNRGLNRDSNCSTQLSHKRSDRRFRGLWQRGGVYQYRVRVPGDVIGAIGRTHINRSLKTCSLSEARHLAISTAFDIEKSFQAARNGAITPLPATTPPERPGRVASTVPVGISLSEAYQAYLADPSRRASPKSNLAYRTVGNVIMDLLGPETPLRQITRQACRDVLIDLGKMPRNAKKRWPSLNARQAIARGARDNIPTMSVANVNGHLNKFCAMLNWAVREEHLDKNPALGLRLPDPVRAKDKRKPFSTEQLQKIFNAPLFTGCVDDEHGYAKPGTNRPRRARFWVPLIGLYTGARLNEICQLDTNDIKKFEGVWCLSITGSSDAPNSNKRLKTTSSDRIVPIHPNLLELGLIEYTNKQRNTGFRKLFPELEFRHGIYSHEFSRWFGRFLARCGAAQERTCFHSFRHNFADALRAAKVEREIAMALGGWTGSADRSEADRYGSQRSPKGLISAVSRIDYQGLDLSHLIPHKLD